ncbi:predicted protein [Naegleria gruberi]|uniref:Predicted protein n=1 Tax=Naegleria gruberi TaxID=5762 RepID=D2VU07_NAEGR|nr:uncharacterized protein NAEGRDRAFT_72495 [Naegleria gruberi]EFC39749.1 predicted protein [Naegleria gruberi]|eukprot:XP_002672493.1 predicted protein [Naegleria gruberi strain NEG-M]
MTKVVRTTPIDRSKRTAVKGDVVSEVNIIHGKRKRRLSNNSFTDDYIVSSPKTPKKNKKKTKKTQQKKKELSESSEDDDEQAEESESGDEIIIPLSGNRNKYKIVDEDDEEEEMELKQEPEEEMYSLFSQELKRTERKKKQSSSSAPKELSTKVKTEEPAIAVCDCSEFGPIPVDPYKFFSKKIVDNVKRLGGEFPEFYDSRIPIVYNDVKFFSPDSLRLFTLIKWGGKQCTFYSII